MGHAANFLYMLFGARPNATAVRAMDIALTLHADHELNASTFAARVAAATLTDIHSAIVAGIGTLKGPLHGGANAEVMKMLIEIGQDAPADRIDAFVKGKFARKEKISGFGHRVYRTEDPRATHLRQMSKQLGQQVGNLRWFEMSERIEAPGEVGEEAVSERGLLLGFDVLHDGHRHRSLHADLRRQPHFGLDRARAGATGEQPADPAASGLYRARPTRSPGCPWSSADSREQAKCKAQVRRHKARQGRREGLAPVEPTAPPTLLCIDDDPLQHRIVERLLHEFAHTRYGLRQRPHLRRWAGKAGDGCVYRLPARLQARPRHGHRPAVRVTATEHRDAGRRDDRGGHRRRGHRRGRGRRGRFPAQVRAHARACWNAPCATPRSWERPCASCGRWR